MTALTGSVNTYNLQVVGSIGSFTSVTQTFVLTVTDNCATATINVVTVPAQTYIVSDSPLTFSFTDWTTSFSYCTAFVYSVVISAPAPATLPTSYLTYSSKSFTVSTSTLTNANVYTVSITGSIGSNT